MDIYYGFFIFSLLVGGSLLIKWLATTQFGTKSLESAPPRPNIMPFYFPFVVLFGWIAFSSLGSEAADALTSKMTDWRQKFATFSVFFSVEAIAVVFIIYSAKTYFANGLAGFGLRLKNIWRDLVASAGVYIAVWPFVVISLMLVVFIGKLIAGPDFSMEKNEGMVVLLEYKQLSLRILMILFAAGLTPIFEELVFRGLLQTYLRQTLGYSPWQSIFLVSGIFAILHPIMHFPGIFILSAAMGYVYESSGSLLRSMFIHCFFNGSQIAMALLIQS